MKALRDHGLRGVPPTIVVDPAAGTGVTRDRGVEALPLASPQREANRLPRQLGRGESRALRLIPEPPIEVLR